MLKQILAEFARDKEERGCKRDDDQTPPIEDLPDALPARKPWARPQLVPLDVGSTEQADDIQPNVS